MTPDEHLQHLRRDAARLRAVAARDLEARVPSCPEWDVRALVEHVASVYEHKVACIRLGRRPDDGEWGVPADDVLGRYDAALAELVSELESRGPHAPAWTWYPPDQSSGFWFRRMAQETAVHRFDAELAAGDTTPIDEALAVDGIDEVLATFLGGPWYVDEPAERASGRSVLVSSGGSTWHVTLGREAVPVVTDDTGGATELVVTGPPGDTLLWLWGGRVDDDVVTVDGPADLAAELRARLDFVVD